MSRNYFVSGLVVVSLLGLTMTSPLVATAAASQQSADVTLKDKIVFRIDTTNTVRKYDIKVAVDRGVATLSGKVATAAQKAEAARIAAVNGVTKVVNNIIVDIDEDKSLADKVKNGMSKSGEKISDAWIHTKVNWFFLGEDSLKGSKIDVDTKDNVVTLNGTVTNPAGKARAEELAKNTDGVKRVVNNLKIGAK
jgi:hyperosmotically inducible protein